MSSNALYIFDFSVPEAVEQFEERLPEYITNFGRLAKHWAFQLERGEQNGYIHLQCRVSLHKKKRAGEFILMMKNCNFEPFTKAHITPTSNNGTKKGFDYVIKYDTCILGPWQDTDENIKELIDPPYIPRQVREIESLYPWQEYIVNDFDVWDKRYINLFYNASGNIGKSTLVSICRAYKLARVLPPVNETKDLLRMVCDMPTSKAYMFDMPRAMNKDRLYQFYAAIETIKDGYAYDDRYHFTEKVFDCPAVWIFSNRLPDLDLLSNDRWKIWCITEKEGNLLRLDPTDKESLGAAL